MIPEVDVVLRGIMMKLLGEVAPAVVDRYVRGNVEMIAALLGVAAEEFDRAVELRVEENRALRAIFREASVETALADFCQRLATAASERDVSYRVSDLNVVNARLRALLIELHAEVEERVEPWAKRIARSISRELEASAGRRAISFFPL